MCSLENGWLLMKEKDEREYIGYCEKCERPIYIDSEYKRIDGILFCSSCAREIEEEYD